MTLLLRLTGVLLLAALITIAWLTRHQIQAFFQGGTVAAVSGDTGRPGSNALIRAGGKVDSLESHGADSVVLTASEIASLIGNGLDRQVRRDIDSLKVELGDDVIGLSGNVTTTRLPRELLGPFGTALGPKEPVAATGRLIVTGPGSAEWRVERLRVRNFSFGQSVTAKIVEQGLGGSSDGGIRFKLPPGIDDIRVRPTGVTLYRAPAP